MARGLHDARTRGLVTYMAGNARRGCGVLVLRAAMQCAFEREGAAAGTSRGNQPWHAAVQWAAPRLQRHTPMIVVMPSSMGIR